MRAERRSEWAGIQRLLVVRLDALGDLLMTTPAIHAFREANPGLRISLLTSPSGAALGPYLEDVDEIIPYEAPWMKATAPRDSAPDFAIIERLRSGRFDAAVLFTVYSQNPLPAALLCFLAEIPRRLAYCRENPYQLLTDWAKELEPESLIRHEVQRHLDLAETVVPAPWDQRMRFAVQPADRERVIELLAETGLDNTRAWVAVHPGATAPSRRYPPENYARMLALLAAEGVQAVLTGSADEAEANAAIIRLAGCPAVSLAGRLSLGELGALLALAPVVISNNTGPAHLAAAVGTPVVDLYALTNPQHTPWGVPNVSLAWDVPCRFCYRSICPEGHHDCLRRVQPEWVAQAVLGLLAGVAPARIYAALPDGLYRQFPTRSQLPVQPAALSRNPTMR
jgi:lipopolysaccharide heptosyltransferase II